MRPARRINSLLPDKRFIRPAASGAIPPGVNSMHAKQRFHVRWDPISGNWGVFDRKYKEVRVATGRTRDEARVDCAKLNARDREPGSFSDRAEDSK